MGFEDRLKQDLRLEKRVGFNPYYRPVHSALGRRVVVDDREVINLGSNDYLGLTSRPEMKQAALEAIERFGLSMCCTPIVLGYSEMLQDLEQKLAELFGKEDALVFPSGYQANEGVFSVLAEEGDAIIMDALTHASLIQGARATPAKEYHYPHNNMELLEALLKNQQDKRRRFIAVDGLFSTEGDVALLDEIVALARKYDAIVIVDDAHGLGVLGETGRGSLELKGVLGRVDIVTGSLGKALGSCGGFIAGDGDEIKELRYYCSNYIYSTALPPVMAAPAIKALELLDKTDAERKRLWANKDKLYKAVKDMGYSLTPSNTPLFSVMSEDPEEILLLAKDLMDNGVYGTPFIPPSVPSKHSCLRLIPHAGLTDEDIDAVIEVFEKLRGDHT